MYIIVGLGNPGQKYEHTRHNAGFEVIDILADRMGINVEESKHKGLLGRGMLEGQKPVFRRSTRKIPTFCFLESQKSNFTQPENPLFSTKFQCPIWAFFIEKIYFLWYNNSTS